MKKPIFAEKIITKDQFINKVASRSKEDILAITWEALGFIIQFKNMLMENTEPMKSDKDFNNRVTGLAKLREQFAYYYMLANVCEGLIVLAETFDMKEELAYEEDKELQQIAIKCAEFCNVDVDKWKDANG